MVGMIRHAKVGFAIDAITSHHTDANRAHGLLEVMAYHLALWFPRNLGAGPVASHRFIDTVRRPVV